MKGKRDIRSQRFLWASHVRLPAGTCSWAAMLGGTEPTAYHVKLRWPGRIGRWKEMGRAGVEGGAEQGDRPRGPPGSCRSNTSKSCPSR